MAFRRASELGVGSVTASALQIGLGMAGILAGVGFMFILAGLGLVWVARAETEPVKAPVLRPASALAWRSATRVPDPELQLRTVCSLSPHPRRARPRAPLGR